MALEFLLNVKIEPWKKTRIKIPNNANCYSLRSGNIKFFMSNPALNKNMKKIVDNAFEIEIYMEKNAYNIEYGKPKFYDSKGNDLKI